MEQVKSWFPTDVEDRYEIVNYNHAAEILTQSFQSELSDIIMALRRFTISKSEILELGGNESPIPPKFYEVLDPLGWKEIKISGDLIVKFYERKGNRKGVFAKNPEREIEIKNYIDGHNIDFIKNRIALDVEWNSKDQTYDRDLYALRTYYECGIISVGIIITRSESMNDVFRELDVMSKYGASTTWMGKLIPRLESRRHGGCPILALAITPKCVTDWHIEAKNE